MGKKAPGREFFDVRLGPNPSQTLRPFVSIRCHGIASSANLLHGARGSPGKLGLGKSRQNSSGWASGRRTRAGQKRSEPPSKYDFGEECKGQAKRSHPQVTEVCPKNRRFFAARDRP